MYRKKDDLQILIDTMSPAEKRHFVQFSGSRGKKGTSLYLHLFEQLCKGEEPVIKSASPQGLIITKRTLYQNILRSLISYRATGTEANLENMLLEVEILYDRNLLDQSVRVLYKAKNEAGKQEKYGLIIQLLEWERKISALSDTPHRTIAQIAEEEQTVADCLNNIFDLERLFSKTIEYKRKYGYIRGDFSQQFYTEIIYNPLLETTENCLSQKALYYFYYAKALSYFMVFDYDGSYKNSKMLLSADRNIIPLHDYLNGVLHHTTSCICLGLFEETLEYLQLSQILINEKQLDLFNILSLKVFYYRSNYEMICSMYMGETERTKTKIQEIEESLIKFKERVPYEMRQVINSGLRNGYMSIGSGKNVNRIIDEMLNKETKLTRNDIYDDLMLFRLIWLIQDRTYEIIPSVALSTYRYYSGYNCDDNKYTLELKISKLLTKDYDYTSAKELMALLSEIKKMLSDYIKELNPRTHVLEHCSYYLIWINGLIKGDEFCKEAKVWYETFTPDVNVL